ncbi:MAG TPA: VIT1/CCC1 transporter family protein [Gammaproteobacteria bacterium]|nr:VIT1/CCC1 transporter family protein [Gammaproteobacteria bacterium]
MADESEFESWHEEKQSAYLYRVVADCERSPEIRAMFLKLADAADAQAEHWRKIATGKGVTLPGSFQPKLRAQLVAHMLRRLGPERMLPVLAAMKVRGLSVYTHGAPGGHGAPIAGQQESRHRRMAGSGSFRAAVFGVNDGLISNASLILGMAGASAGEGTVLLAGVAGMLAGAASMAAGEYVSMRSQREMFEYQIGLEDAELKAYPEEEAEELALIYEARGIPPADATRMADTLIRDPSRALDTLAREELGLNPRELGSPWGAAIASFAAFAAGAIVPLLPFIWHGAHDLGVAIGLTLVGLFGTGAVVSLFTGRSPWWSGLRMMLIGAAAGAVTWLVGHMFGVG